MSGERISVTDQDCNPPRLHFLYHELRAFPSQYSYALQVSAFKRHLDLFAEAAKEENPSLSVEITFDDGHASDFEFVLPILNARGLTARFFITAGWTGRRPGYMGWSELNCLRDAGQVIGSHGWSHKLLTCCSRTELRVELGRSRSLLEDKLGIPVTIMSLPGGRYNDRVISACHEAGYTKVYTSVPAPELHTNEFMVGRVNMNSHMTAYGVARLLQPDGGELIRLRSQYRKKEAAKRVLGDWMYDKLWNMLFRNQRNVRVEASASDEYFADHQ
jgi:peptidoglycan/xylan/chitin deacetylase (PgdA/CDA1 family)